MKFDRLFYDKAPCGCYRVVTPYYCDTGIKLRPRAFWQGDRKSGIISAGNGIVTLHPNGVLRIDKGYRWNGASGGAVDTKSFMAGSCVHDALYYLGRKELIPQEMRKPVDKLMYDMIRDHGMFWLRAQWVYRAVRLGGGSSFAPFDNKVRTAP